MEETTRPCSVDGCEKTIRCKGLCNGHYKQHLKGQELRPLGSELTFQDRFWSKVNKEAPGGCWEWRGNTCKGCGRIWCGSCFKAAHRVSWEFVNGTIPEGMFLDHRCHNRRCVNPKHLRVVTQSQNMQHRTGAQRNGSSGVRGVCWNKKSRAWHVQVGLNGHQYYGGIHSTLEEAEAAARALRAELHTHDDHDEWLRRH